MNSSELKSMPIAYAEEESHIGETTNRRQVLRRGEVTRYWCAFGVTLGLIFVLLLWRIYSPDQDHLGSISLNGDGSWFHNYEIGFEIQDQEIFFNGIGHSIANAQRADVIFLGPSTVLFGIDWRLFEEFERKHHLRMFNMSFAGIGSGAFSLELIKKWGLHPKLWIINAEEYKGDFNNSFFHMSLPTGGSFRAPGDAVKTGWLRAYLNVLGRNIRWRFKLAMGGLQHDSYRSVVSGNWYLDNWPNQMLDSNPHITSWVGRHCPENADEVVGAHRFFDAIGGAKILIQVPSVLACAQRINELASALSVPSFTVDPEPFTSGDGGGHLDRVSSRKYTALLFTWLERQPEFQKLFPVGGQE